MTSLWLEDPDLAYYVPTRFHFPCLILPLAKRLYSIRSFWKKELSLHGFLTPVILLSQAFRLGSFWPKNKLFAKYLRIMFALTLFRQPSRKISADIWLPFFHNFSRQKFSPFRFDQAMERVVIRGKELMYLCRIVCCQKSDPFRYRGISVQESPAVVRKNNTPNFHTMSLPFYKVHDERSRFIHIVFGATQVPDLIDVNFVFGPCHPDLCGPFHPIWGFSGPFSCKQGRLYT